MFVTVQLVHLQDLEIRSCYALLGQLPRSCFSRRCWRWSFASPCRLGALWNGGQKIDEKMIIAAMPWLGIIGSYLYFVIYALFDAFWSFEKSDGSWSQYDRPKKVGMIATRRTCSLAVRFRCWIFEWVGLPDMFVLFWHRGWFCWSLKSFL